MRQRIKNTLAILAGIWILSSCELNLIPESDLSDEVFWQSDADFRQALNYFYKAIEIGPGDEFAYPLMNDVMSDNAISGTLNEVGNGTYLPSSNFGPWDKNYRIIREANNIIENANSYESASSPGFIAEAKFFRAYAYADLVRRYGDVPLIMKTLDTDDEELYAPRTPRAVVMDSIYADLDYAAAYLPLDSELDPAESYGLVSKGTALAIKSRAALREGTWNKFHNSGNYESHLQIAKDAALAVIESSEY